MATAIARLLQTALRALRNTSADPSSLQSTMMASKRSRVSLRRAFSESAHSSTSISRSLKVRRSTRTIFSSEQSSNDFKLIARSLTFDRCTQAFEKGGVLLHFKTRYSCGQLVRVHNRLRRSPFIAQTEPAREKPPQRHRCKHLLCLHIFTLKD